MTQSEMKPLISAAKGLKSSTYPVWFLRQAGRYLPEYQKIRSKLSFLELCRNPKLAAEVTIQPLKRFDLDAAIIFSDILIPPAHMGQSLTFDKGHGPLLTPVIRQEADLSLLKPLDKSAVSYLGEAISITKSELSSSQTMIGFAGAPFTVASYMIEGSGSKTYLETKKMIFSQARTFFHLMDILTQATISYLEMQVEAGAEVLMLFDSWAGNLAPDDYQNHVIPHLKTLFDALDKLKVPLIYYSGQGSSNLNYLDNVKASVLAIDWRVSLTNAQSIVERYPHVKCLQGNLDPLILSCEDQGLVKDKVQKLLEESSELKLSHIFNVGHGLLPSSKTESISTAINEIRAYRSLS